MTISKKLVAHGRIANAIILLLDIGVLKANFMIKAEAKGSGVNGDRPTADRKQVL